jgi:DNA replicative helicase MCM subunit Mcm2 (Cdc46/Mcm family)
MEDDDLSILGVNLSDRKKLEHMGITTLEQIVLMSPQALGLGSTKGNMLIQRACNVLAHKNIVDIIIKDEDHVEVVVKKSDRAGVKAVLTILEVIASGHGNASLQIENDLLKLSRKSQTFNKVLRKADVLQEVFQSKKIDEREQQGIFLPDDEIKKFARQRGFQGFWQNVFHEIKGNDVMKKVITTSMFSTFEEPVHALIIGEPGSSKTMAKEIINERFKNVVSIGANTTRSGLVCHMGTGDLGALPHADNKLVLIDEFDKIPQDDIEYCYELLSNGKCSVHSAKIHQNIQSNFIMIAFANPKSRVFGKHALADIGLSPLLISRCALVVRVQDIAREERLDLFKRKFYGTGELKEKHEYFDQWVKLARTYEPDITASEKTVDHYIEEADNIVERFFATTLRRDLRMGDYIRRIPFSIARSQFSPVDDNTVKEAENLLKESVDTWA